MMTSALRLLLLLVATLVAHALRPPLVTSAPRPPLLVDITPRRATAAAGRRSRPIVAKAYSPPRAAKSVRRILTDDGYTFDSEPFQRYGGSSAWWGNLKTTVKSRVFNRISGHLSATVAVAVLVTLAFAAANDGYLPSEAAVAVQACALPGLPHEAIGSFIGLLLAFRTSQAYERFWEARTHWDGIYSNTRAIVRLVTAVRDEEVSSRRGARRFSFANDGGDASSRGANAGDANADVEPIIEVIVGLTAAFPYALKQHLRGVPDLKELADAAAAATDCSRKSPTMRQLLTASRQPNVPLAVLDRLSRSLLQLRKCGVSDLLWWQLDAKAEALIALLSQVERIKGTPVPLSYSRHTSRFFSIYTFTLPLALANHMNLWLLPATVGVMSWVIFATEEIGHIIEEPFGRGLSDDIDEVEARSSSDDLVTDNEGRPVQLEVLPLGRYCADIASDAATMYLASPTDIGEMPGGDDELTLFDELS